MAVAPRYLIDKSALARLRHPDVLAELLPLIVRDQIASCGVLELEVLYSARNHADFVSTLADLRGYPRIDAMQADFERAVEVMELLAPRGQHRALQLPDLLTAAIAERAGLTILHYDVYYDLVADVTGQAARWVVPRGSVP